MPGGGDGPHILGVGLLDVDHDEAGHGTKLTEEAHEFGYHSPHRRSRDTACGDHERHPSLEVHRRPRDGGRCEVNQLCRRRDVTHGEGAIPADIVLHVQGELRVGEGGGAEGTEVGWIGLEADFAKGLHLHEGSLLHPVMVVPRLGKREPGLALIREPHIILDT